MVSSSIFAALAFLASVANAGGAPHVFDVPHVTTVGGAHEAFVAAHPRLLVAFYFPQCTACHELQTPLEEAAAAATAEGLPPVVAVDCANGHDGNFCRPHTRGFPTIRYFGSGEWAAQSSPDDEGPKFDSPMLSYNNVLAPLSDRKMWTESILKFLRNKSGAGGADGKEL